jgi:hypothetical protein
MNNRVLFIFDLFLFTAWIFDFHSLFFMEIQREKAA